MLFFTCLALGRLAFKNRWLFLSVHFVDVQTVFLQCPWNMYTNYITSRMSNISSRYPGSDSSESIQGSTTHSHHHWWTCRMPAICSHSFHARQQPAMHQLSRWNEPGRQDATLLDYLIISHVQVSCGVITSISVSSGCNGVTMSRSWQQLQKAPRTLDMSLMWHSTWTDPNKSFENLDFKWLPIQVSYVTTFTDYQ